MKLFSNDKSMIRQLSNTLYGLKFAIEKNLFERLKSSNGKKRNDFVANPIFRIRPVSLMIFKLLCSTCCIVQRDILYYKYNYKFPSYNRMAKTLEPFLSVRRNLSNIYLYMCAINTVNINKSKK